MKRAYGIALKDFIKSHITYVIKVEFFIAFKAAYFTAITEKNIKGGFRGAGLIPFDPEAVISKLDIKLRTLTLIRSPLATAEP